MGSDCYLNALIVLLLLLSVSSVVSVQSSGDALGAPSSWVPPAAAQYPTSLSSQPAPKSQPPMNSDHRQQRHQFAAAGWTFDGVLDPDGSFSSAKFMHEPNPSSEGLCEDKPRRSISYNSSHVQTSEPTESVGPRPCPADLRDFIPCLHDSDSDSDSVNASSNDVFERDCRRWDRVVQPCVIATPENYARQFKWPTSKTQVRRPNIPNVPLLSSREWQPWIQPHGSSVLLRGAEPKFPNGTLNYFNDLQAAVPGLAFGERVRTVLDIGCGAGHAAADLEERGAITLSVPGEGSCENGVQLIVERGYPSMLQALDANRLPYPSQAFDLIHCAACLVDWTINDGLKLLEADRILRAGGFFVWADSSDPEAATRGTGMEALTERICWTSVALVEGLRVWRKSTNQSCYLLRTGAPSRSPPICDRAAESSRPRIPWKEPLRKCIWGFPAPGAAEAMAVRWPQRAEQPPSRLREAPAAGLERAKDEAYEADLRFWKSNVDVYVTGFGEQRVREIRNVLDMNAGYGGFAAAVSLLKTAARLDWWVLSVAPVDMPDRLALIFDRGLIGVYHDWCLPFQLHPRSFDLVHASRLYPATHRCGVEQMVREIDRLLRPGGFALFRDDLKVLATIQAVAAALRWKTDVVETESGPKGKNKVLSCQKTFWRPQSR
ncbi:protein MpPMT.2 [Marchantia polymorpha subsp. ruderalis]|uniref:Methyltransferase n=4 Tax=Marchantia polymorpha TaxID=3197 RepID=A0AAF6AR09_MARPO|nr:hypothetical protein MARPO_0001s0032 [Marchantia polymorpha]BBM98879.1 hypothetical protein Mp_1g16920 [Marchantia polymorpha subsp. ruderalis]|eukprot:PTQ49956.1 hypothetical protein MARPO_0001s0032 [Marchantia polymorpha]